MPFDAASYEGLLDTLRQNRDSWESAQTLADCQQAISGIGGIDAERYNALVEELGSHHGGDEQQMFQQLRLTALAWPAADFGLTGPEWQGYFVTELADGQQLYAADRFARPQQWAEVEVSTQALALSYDSQAGLLYDEANWYLPDGQTIVTPDQDDPATSRDAAGNVYIRGVLQEGAAPETDQQQTHFDPVAQRWRRWPEDGGEFEYYHESDGVWERLLGTDLWHRYHSDQHGWLPYDRDSNTWLDPEQNRWRSHEEIGTATPVAPTASAPDQPAAAETASSTAIDDDQDLQLSDLEPDLQAFLAKLYERNPEHKKIPIRTVLEVVAESEPYL